MKMPLFSARAMKAGLTVKRVESNAGTESGRWASFSAR